MSYIESKKTLGITDADTINHMDGCPKVCQFCARYHRVLHTCRRDGEVHYTSRKNSCDEFERVVSIQVQYDKAEIDRITKAMEERSNELPDLDVLND